MTSKLALVIGNSKYDDRELRKLAAPVKDVNSLSSLLRAPEIGGFDDVLILIDKPHDVVHRAIARLFAERHPNDLLLLYFSGHGVLDEEGILHLAVKDTESSLISGTAIEADFILRQMDKSRSKRQILILDCCYSGAFTRGMKGAPKAVTKATFEGNGFGRVVLTATDATQPAWEGSRVINSSVDHSAFTHFLIHGLSTGEADMDQDGYITIDELYEYAFEQITNTKSKQTPRKWAYSQQGKLIIAQRAQYQHVQPVTFPTQKPKPDLPKAIREVQEQRPYEKQAITIARDVYDQILDYAWKYSPNMAAGFLLGRDNHVMKVIPFPNLETTNPRARFRLAPENYLEAERIADRDEMVILGLFYSQDQGAGISEETREWAQPFYVYLVIGLGTHPPSRRAYKLSEDRTRFIEYHLSIV